MKIFDEIRHGLRKSGYITLTLVSIDVVLAYVYSRFVDKPFVRTSANLMVLEGGLLLMAAALLFSKRVKTEYREVSSKDGPSNSDQKGSWEIPLLLCSVTLILLGFLTDFVYSSL